MLYPGKKTVMKLAHAATRNMAGVITGIATKDPVAALTFDDGPDPVYTPRVLDILRKFGAQATFFMVGEGAHAYQDIVGEVARGGHAIGNHTWSHPEFSAMPFRERRDQIRKCQHALGPHGERLFRPPYGLNSKKSNLGVRLEGYKIIGWSLSADDWREPNADAMADTLKNNTTPGSIILLHDRLFVWTKAEKGAAEREGRIVDREAMLSALTNLLEALSAKIRFVTIPVLLRHGPALLGWA